MKSLMVATLVLFSTQAHAEGWANPEWGNLEREYEYEGGGGTNYQFINGNNVTTISQGNDGTSSAVITNHNDSGAAVSSTYYNSSGQDIGAALYNQETGAMTTYNRCGEEGRPGDPCTWTNPETGEQVHVD